MFWLFSRWSQNGLSVMEQLFQASVSVVSVSVKVHFKFCVFIYTFKNSTIHSLIINIQGSCHISSITSVIFNTLLRTCFSVWLFAQINNVFTARIIRHKLQETDGTHKKTWSKNFTFRFQSSSPRGQHLQVTLILLLLKFILTLSFPKQQVCTAFRGSACDRV